MVREHHVVVLPTNHISVLYMKLYVNSGSHAQYTHMIGLGVQLRSTLGPCKYFSLYNGLSTCLGINNPHQICTHTYVKQYPPENVTLIISTIILYSQKNIVKIFNGN